MITHLKLSLYLHYGGYLDLWHRTAPKEHKAWMTDADWVLIDEYVGKSMGGVTSAKAQLGQQDLLLDCENAEVAARLKAIANNTHNENPSRHPLYRFLIWLFRLKQV